MYDPLADGYEDVKEFIMDLYSDLDSTLEGSFYHAAEDYYRDQERSKEVLLEQIFKMKRFLNQMEEQLQR